MLTVGDQAARDLADLFKRVTALEEDNARLAALREPGAGTGVLLDGEAPETPMRDAFEVRSEVTGAVVGRHEERSTAADECDRLNAEARREGIRHLGEIVRYEIVPVRVVDEDAARELRITDLKQRIDAAEGDARDALVDELEREEAVVDG